MAPDRTATHDMTRWTPKFLELPVHTLIAHQFDRGVRGKASTIVHGPRGVGKTTLIQRLIDRFDREQMERERTTGERAAQVLYYETSAATGTKTVLVDLYLKLIRRPMNKRSKQDWTPTAFIQQITETVIDQHVCLICIDEAQMIDVANLDLLRQVPDVAKARNHDVRLLLIGNDGLRRNVAATGQLGERFTGLVAVPPLVPSEVGPHLARLHPGLGELQASLPAKEWKGLERALFACARGSFRRLVAIIDSAHELALKRKASLSANHLEWAMEAIADTEGC